MLTSVYNVSLINHSFREYIIPRKCSQYNIWMENVEIKYSQKDEWLLGEGRRMNR